MSVIKPQEINLDFSQNSYKDIVVKQNDVDSRTVIVTCTNNGVKVPIDYVSQLCHIEMLTPDERPIYNAVTVLSDGRIQIDFDEQMTLASGKTIATLQVVDSVSDEIIHTMNLNVIIVANAISDDDIIATPEYGALTEALMNVGDCTELVRSIEVVEANEEERKDNEASRIETFAEMEAKVDTIPDGMVCVDFVDQKETDIALIERINGISIYVNGNNDVMASWDNNGTTAEKNLSSGSGGSSDITVPTKVSELENDAGYINSTRKIAGVDLEDDITAEELKTALGVFDSTVTAGELKPWLYDTENEVEIGVYNGKPLYRKTVVFPLTSFSGADGFVFDAENNIEYYEHIYLSNDSCVLSGNKSISNQSIPLNYYLQGDVYVRANIQFNDTLHWYVYMMTNLPAILENVSTAQLRAVIEYTKTTDAEGSGNSLNPYGIYDAKLDTIEARLEALENIDIAEGGAY